MLQLAVTLVACAERSLALSVFHWARTLSAILQALKELASIQVPIPATQFEGPSGAVEEHLLLFRGSHEAACRMADSVLAQWNTLRARLRSAQATNVTANCNMEYTPAVETVDSKIAQLLDEKNKMERYCETREQRWTWCLQRNQLILNVEKVCLSVCMSVCLSVCLYVCLSVCLTICVCSISRSKRCGSETKVTLLS